MAMIFESWSAAAGASNADQDLGHLRNTARSKWVDQMINKAQCARRNKDWRSLWEYSRELGCTSRGSKKRNYKDVKRTDPTIEEWSKAMAQSGGEGGCEATVIATDDKPFDLKIYGLTKVEDPQSHNGAERGDYDPK